MNIQEPNPACGAHLDAYAGIPTFMRQPASRQLDSVDVTIVGVPFDSGAVSFRSGARLGPRKIREASLIMWGHHPTWKIAPHKTLKIVDYGDVEVQPVDIAATVQAIAAEVTGILKL